jgi:CBS domain-containing protein
VKRVVQHGLTISDILSIKGGSIITIRPDQTAVEAAQRLRARRIGILLVAEASGRVIGVLSERDIVGAVAKHGEAGPSQLVQDIMSKKIVVCQPFDDAKGVMMTMKNGGFRHMPVMQDGAFKGLVSIGDILHHLLEHDQLLEDQSIISNL